MTFDCCDTIAAVATASGPGAIAVLRLSGPDSLRIAGVLGANTPALEVRKASLRRLRKPDGTALDECLVTYFEVPRSFTGEDIVEISAHGGYATVRAVYQALLEAGARPADPGEFSKRAFVNGKLDLAQAEGLNHLIRARTELQMTAAKQALDGALSRRVHDVSNGLTQAAAGLEASIDFPEDVEEPGRGDLAAALDGILARLEDTTALARRGRLISTGVRMAIVGRPNVGKSSLLNLLAGRPRAIVSEVAGTTRDFLEEQVEIGGVPVVAIDTAGIRETDDPIEKEGARRALETLESADVGLIVLDASTGMTGADLDVVRMAGDRAVVVWNKIDIAGQTDSGTAVSTREARICALTGEGLEELEQIVLASLGAGAGYFEEAIAATERQVQTLVSAGDMIREAVSAVRSPLALDLAAVSMQSARQMLGEITGETTSETLIDAIFSTFCIGK